MKQKKVRINKIKSTLLERYGSENYSQTLEFKDKVKNTWKNKSQEEIDIIVHQRWDTNLEKYGKLNNGDKISKTLLSKDKKFWEERNEKIKNTSLERYNEEYYMKTDEYKQRIQDTWNNKPKEDVEEMVRKCKETTLQIYGVDHYTKLPDFIERVKQTNMERYGVEFSSQLPEVKEKIKNTCLNKYGVENYSQTSEFSKSRRKRIEYDGLTFDSSWEVIVYQYCKKYNKEFEYQPNIHFEYVFDNKVHYYQPDFLIDGELYEVKGDQFFEGDKMICPYDRNKDELFESKHQCMLSNNVKILRREDIEKMKEML